ncbi:GTPase-activating protein for Gpa1p, regulates desensitization to alpha factor pheromone [Komagataella phaffii GS115]|uniref:GTPase-activating protein for Gpa1p, regulates desensitization to alpha factor pheromone n=2 Tax=Komagataella phaffii TaxID=460519 RepID=C4R5Q5_KOMPG|nr:GTPase-activating protein for Gpa1p, regulates desensitization to alpha factor pheromone [Komagataella phaffii GS115]AOA63513.1 GQ67_03949T0 [Komagataella phaffii]AOA68807.1 GQ68_03923T0 [Komagataella phaffii GS115]CAY70891.1 GTPase-activating protein for Gpa1p, regulates desensitization to alpha factor pheromone [Komagataella phaffii GS115]
MTMANEQSIGFNSKEIKYFFSLLILSLQLEAGDPSESGLFGIFKLQLHNNLYCFKASHAIVKLNGLSLNIKSVYKNLCISCSMDLDSCLALLNMFLRARLIHCPRERTLISLDEKHLNTLLQPTPKGLDIMFMFCIKLGITIDQMPSVLRSPLNSMQLFYFERNSTTNRLLVSKSLIRLIFIKLMGPEPNIWDPMTTLEPSVSYEDKLRRAKLLLGNRPLDTTLGDNKVSGKSGKKSNKPGIELQANSWDDFEYMFENTKSKESQTHHSPLAHRFFNNPNSDSNSQYYVSSKGIRLFKNHKVVYSGHKKLVEYCFLGKTMVQWLIDCTDILFKEEAQSICEYFIQEGLIQHVNILFGSVSSYNRDYSKFHMDIDDLYILTSEGYRILDWCFQEPIEPNIPLVDIQKVLNDPAFFYLLKVHLTEELCLEILMVYIEIEGVLEKLQRLSQTQDQPTSHKSVNQCSAMILNIYLKYLAPDAVHNINIDHATRNRVTQLIHELIRNHTTESFKYVTNTNVLINSVEISLKEIKNKMSQNLTEVPRYEDENEYEVEGLDQNDSSLVLDQVREVFNEIKGKMYTLMQKDVLIKLVNSAQFRKRYCQIAT